MPVGDNSTVMSWARLMSARRLMSSETGEDDPHRSPFEVDGDRIAFTTAWRLASNKTQVHEPDPAGVPVRTRGTHSNEVSRVGRSLGQLVGHTIIQRHGMASRFSTHDIAHCVAAAGFAHDLGNPPMGHAGEEVIADFFSHGAGSHLISDLSKIQKAEFCNVDGNAQGFRLVTRLTGWRPVGGLQLTCASLATLVKYPFEAVDGTKPWGRRKYGFYSTERDLFKQVSDEVGLIEKSPGIWCRHPLVHLLEGADDLCYLVVDTVDAAMVGDLTFRDAVDLLGPLLDGLGDEFKEVPGPERKLEYLQSRAIGRLVKDVATAFLDGEGQILEGKHPGDLLEASPVAAQLKVISDTARARLYKSERRLRREATGGVILKSILEDVSSALVDRERSGDVSECSSEILNMAFSNYEQKNMPMDRYGWLRSMVDGVMGMTDARAYSLALMLRPELSDTLKGSDITPLRAIDSDEGLADEKTVIRGAKIA